MIFRGVFYACLKLSVILGFGFFLKNDIQQIGERVFCRSRVLREIENIEKLLSLRRDIYK